MKKRERIQKEFCHSIVSELFDFYQLPKEVIELVEPDPIKYIKQVIDSYAEIKANVADKSTDNALLHSVSNAKLRLPRPLEAYNKAQELGFGDYCDWFLEQEKR